MRKKFIAGLDRALAEKKFKNESELCRVANIDKAVFNRFYSTIKFIRGEGEKPTRIKDNINLDTVSNLVDALGGQLIFPWDSDYSDSHAQIIKLQEEVEKLRAANLILDKKLYACEQVCQKFEGIITQQLPVANEVPVEVRQNKS